MREIRSRISEKHGIDLTNPQIQELAARRLEAILDPRTIKPSLMDELRRAAGLPADAAPSESEGEGAIEEEALYASDSGFLRAIRRLLNPLLKLLFNPSAVVDALNGQARRSKAQAAREAEQRRRQTEWNALHFEILRRLVTDVARVEIENQHLANRVESLSARVDFNERRVRGFEQAQHQSKPAGRAPEAPVVAPAASPQREQREQREEAAPSSSTAEHTPSAEASADGSRRRRRRRRGRRSGQPRDITGMPTPGMAGAPPADQSAEGDDFGEEDATGEEMTDEAGVATLTMDEPAVVELEPPSSPRPFELTPPPEEPIQIASSEPDRAPEAPEGSPTPQPVASVERSDPFTPEQS